MKYYIMQIIKGNVEKLGYVSLIDAQLEIDLPEFLEKELLSIQNEKIKVKIVKGDRQDIVDIYEFYSKEDSLKKWLQGWLESLPEHFGHYTIFTIDEYAELLMKQNKGV